MRGNQIAPAVVWHLVSKHTVTALFVAVLALGVAFVGLLLMLSPRVSAQEQDQAPLLWEYTARGLLADDRVRLALSIPIDNSRVLEDAGLAGLLLRAAHPDAAAIGPDRAFAAQLLSAAGIPLGPPRFEEKRRCRIWVGPAIVPGTATDVERRSIARALSDEVARALPDTIGRGIQPCEITPAGSQADIILYAAGEPLRSVPENADAFLGVELPETSPPESQPGGTGGSPQALPAAGSGGLADINVDAAALTAETRSDLAPFLTALTVTAVLGLLGLGVVRRWFAAVEAGEGR